MVETEREIMDPIRSRQKRWLGHILRHDSLLRITLAGQIQGKKAYGRPRTMLLDWLLKTEEGNISYEELKMSAQDRSRWSEWRCKHAIMAEHCRELFYIQVILTDIQVVIFMRWLWTRLTHVVGRLWLGRTLQRDYSNIWSAASGCQICSWNVQLQE